MTKKQLPEKKIKPSERIASLEMNNAILEQALYMDYDDKNELAGLLYVIIEEANKEKPNLWMLRSALKGFRTALMNNQHMTLECAGLDY